METIKTPDGTPMTPPQKNVRDQQAPEIARIKELAAEYSQTENRTQGLAQSLHEAIQQARKAGIPEPQILSAVVK